MAQNAKKVLLGFEDEPVTEKYKNQVNFTTNKFGGKPDLPNNIKLDLPICPLCQLLRPLVMQIYSPLKNSAYHRILYIFACINPNCWTHSESWICVRVQSQDKLIETSDSNLKATSKTNVTDWCSEADDWDDGNIDNSNEQNGNVINMERLSDEDDESCSFEEVARAGLGNLTVEDNRNANKGAFDGAVGRLHSPLASAEIEGDEGEVITIDTPTLPQNNIMEIFHKVTPLPAEFYQQNSQKQLQLQFAPHFISVWEETTQNSNDLHVKELLQEYQIQNDEDLNAPKLDVASSVSGSDSTFEKYEKSNPAHGDKMFHHFLSRVQMNPGQILRYCRDIEQPLLLYPLLPEFTNKKCHYCQGELVFEMQILSTLIPKLKWNNEQKNEARLEFGTVLVFTCKQSCWGADSGVKIETVFLQSEIY